MMDQNIERGQSGPCMQNSVPYGHLFYKAKRGEKSIVAIGSIWKLPGLLSISLWISMTMQLMTVVVVVVFALFHPMMIICSLWWWWCHLKGQHNIHKANHSSSSTKPVKIVNRHRKSLVDKIYIFKIMLSERFKSAILTEVPFMPYL